RRRHLRQGAGFLHAGIAAGMRLQRQDLPERMRRASRQGGDRLHRRLQETARGARHAGGKTRGKKEARKGRQGNEGRQAETEAGPRSVTLVKASLARAFAASSAGKSLPGACARGVVSTSFTLLQTSPQFSASIASAAPAWKPPG